MTLQVLIHTYGYSIIFLGSIFEGETLLILGGLAVREGLLQFPLLLMVGFAGAVTGDTGWFILGRYKGSYILEKWKWFRDFVGKPQAIIHKKPKLISLFLRFMYGFRHVVPFSLGMSSIKTSTFIFYNSLGAIVWVTVVGTAGYFFGNALELFLGDVKRYEFRIIVIAIIGIALINTLVRVIKFILKKYMSEV